MVTVGVVEIIGIYQYQPPLALIEAKNSVGDAQRDQLALHALIGTQIVQAGDGGIVGDALGIVLIVIATLTATYLARYIIM